MNRTILAIDIGSTKICSIIAEVQDGRVQVRGVGKQKAEGIKRGMVTNIEQASRSIRNSVAEASRTSNMNNIDRAIISVSSAYTKSMNMRGVISISANEEITIEKINKVINNAIYNAAIPPELEKIQVLPYAFKLDEISIEDPIGMSGQKLEVFIHIITANRLGIENLKKVVKNAGVEIENIVLSSYASALSVLSDGEKELGVACIDMGGNTCEMMIYSGNSMQFDYHHPVGSMHINNDLAMVLNTHTQIAETLKREHVDLLGRNEDDTEIVKVPTINGEGETQVSRTEVNDIAKARVTETLSILFKALESSGLKKNIGAGVVLTGGMVHISGMLELADALFATMPVRIGRPVELQGLSEDLKDPSSATAVGLILYGAGKYTNYEMDSNEQIRYKRPMVPQDDKETSSIDLSELEISPKVPKKEDIFVEKKTGLLEKALDYAKKLF